MAPRLAILGIVLLSALALVPAAAADLRPACLDPQFPLTDTVTVRVPTGSHWNSNGYLYEDGTQVSATVWADNVAGVAAACVVVTTAPYSYCVNCPW